MELIDHEFYDHVFFEKVEGSPLVNSTLDCLLLLSPLYNPFFDGPLGDKLIHIHVSTLSYPMGAVCCLCIHCRVPIIVIEDDCVCCGESDT